LDHTGRRPRRQPLEDRPWPDRFRDCRCRRRQFKSLRVGATLAAIVLICAVLLGIDTAIKHNAGPSLAWGFKGLVLGVCVTYMALGDD